MHIFTPPLARPQWPQLFQENLRVGSGVGSPRWADLFQSEMPAELLSAGGRRPSFPGAMWKNRNLMRSLILGKTTKTLIIQGFTTKLTTPPTQ